MTDDQQGMPWLPAMFAEQMQEAGEQAVQSQTELFKKFMSGNASAASAASGPISGLNALSNAAMFKTRVQSGGRISIPDAEREALDIEEGDIVQAVVLPIKRSRSDSQ